MKNKVKRCSYKSLPDYVKCYLGKGNGSFDEGRIQIEYNKKFPCIVRIKTPEQDYICFLS